MMTLMKMKMKKRKKKSITMTRMTKNELLVPILDAGWSIDLVHV